MAGAEVEALMAIYCSEGEFTLQNATETEDKNEYSFSLCITCEKADTEASYSAGDAGHSDPNDEVKVVLSFTLPAEYPQVLPITSVSCEKLTRQQTRQLRTDLLEYAQTLLDEFMIMDMIMWVRQNIWTYVTPNDSWKAETRAEDPTWQALLHIDHMRSAQKYTKLITSWAKELDLSGRLLTQGHLILLILQGSPTAIKEYIRRQRTQKVDVDSHGRSCKEKMMSVLCEEPLPRHIHRCQDFKVKKLESPLEMEEEFADMNLSGIYQEYVTKLWHSKS